MCKMFNILNISLKSHFTLFIFPIAALHLPKLVTSLRKRKCIQRLNFARGITTAAYLTIQRLHVTVILVDRLFASRMVRRLFTASQVGCRGTVQPAAQLPAFSQKWRHYPTGSTIQRPYPQSQRHKRLLLLQRTHLPTRRRTHQRSQQLRLTLVMQPAWHSAELAPTSASLRALPAIRLATAPEISTENAACLAMLLVKLRKHQTARATAHATEFSESASTTQTFALALILLDFAAAELLDNAASLKCINSY